MRLVSGEGQLLRVRLKLRIEHLNDWRRNVLSSFPKFQIWSGLASSSAEGRPSPPLHWPNAGKSEVDCVTVLKAGSRRKLAVHPDNR